MSDTTRSTAPRWPQRVLRFSPALGAALMFVTLGACAQSDSAQRAAPAKPAAPSTAVAVFAGGCFWCMEPPYDKLPGVISTTSGYIGGKAGDATYERVSSGTTDHIEAVQVRYDPSKVDYQTLLNVFWRNIDPVAVNRQFCDAGPQYRSAIFYGNAEQKRLAEATKGGLQASGRFDRPIATEILASTRFYPAEDYHQDYYVKNPKRYKFYRWNCGRDQRLEQVWGAAK
ncbi:peptide-methionine (S)-S-oxide reductase MsrA [Cognatilysobacter bugurensis]|uniref:Peptide methionine sulfoxide reductase MsrA n=1 Tax=Cognatilysobacter bugurensis TaxID=543356 RepID=A0A918T2T5_9GAMM|nr:peptide-methionine (S)-S-oxide reductase MsrA [Lysobacter bugurensis]GHA80659.1 peptide methionine sulfoxide reductase MsrA [Lysobacter bugurensis]